MMITGAQIRRCTHAGGSNKTWTSNTGGVTNIPTRNITKKAGPSPESAFSKLTPHAVQLVAKPRYVLKTGPSPHSGQRQDSPAAIGETDLAMNSSAQARGAVERKRMRTRTTTPRQRNASTMQRTRSLNASSQSCYLHTDGTSRPRGISSR